jgi:hypothetical protein
MSTTFRAVARTLLLAGSAIITGTSASAQSPTVIFEGLPHTAVGGATLRLDHDSAALDVGTLDPAGGSGVAVALGGATSWTTTFAALGYRTVPLNLSWAAFADGQRISTAAMRQSGTGFEISATFTGATSPTYSAQVYDDGRLIGAIGGLPPTAHINLGGFSFCETLSELCRIAQEFHNIASGSCMWVIGTGTQRGTFRLPNGISLTGNELRLVEEVRPAGHYPYLTFDAMVIQSNAYQLTLFSETVRR